METNSFCAVLPSPSKCHGSKPQNILPLQLSTCWLQDIIFNRMVQCYQKSPASPSLQPAVISGTQPLPEIMMDDFWYSKNATKMVLFPISWPRKVPIWPIPVPIPGIPIGFVPFWGLFNVATVEVATTRLRRYSKCLRHHFQHFVGAAPWRAIWSSESIVKCLVNIIPTIQHLPSGYLT